MADCSIKFLPHERTISVPAGESLLRAALEAGVHINASCGGEGVCGKCRVLVEEGEVSEGLSERLSREDIEKGYRLACLTKISEDVTIRIPVESGVDKSVMHLQVTPRRTAIIQHPDFESLKEEGFFISPVEKIYLELPPPEPGSLNISNLKPTNINLSLPCRLSGSCLKFCGIPISSLLSLWFVR